MEKEKISQETMEEFSRAFQAKETPVDFLGEIVWASERVSKYKNLNRWYRNSPMKDTKKQMMLYYHLYENKPHFEIEAPKKYIVCAKDDGGHEWFLSRNDHGIMDMVTVYEVATQFSTREEAEMWTNPQTKIVEVEE